MLDTGGSSSADSIFFRANHIKQEEQSDPREPARWRQGMAGKKKRLKGRKIGCAGGGELSAAPAAAPESPAARHRNPPGPPVAASARCGATTPSAHRASPGPGPPGQ